MIGMAPNDVTKANEGDIAKRMFPVKQKLKWKNDIKDKVLRSKFENIFAKG